MSTLRTRDAEHLADFARLAAPLARRAVAITDRGDGPAAHASRLVDHWRREAAVLSAAAGLGGRLSWAAQGAVSAVVQGSLVLCLCELAGVHDPRRRLEVVARACLGSELPEGWQPGVEVHVVTDLGEPARRNRLREAGRSAWAVWRVVGRRQEGRLWQRALSNVPVVGAAGALLGERHALAGIAVTAARELDLPLR